MMAPILLHELKSYFQAPLGYTFVGAVFMFTGIYFYSFNLHGGAVDLSAQFSVLYTVVLFLIPLLTMRLMSEDIKNKTDQFFLTAPVSRVSIVMGKFSAAVIVYFIAIFSTIIDAVLLSVLHEVSWTMIFGNFIGLFLLGSALIAICMFISSLTGSQLIAAVGGFLVGVFNVMAESLAVDAKEPLKSVLTSLSFSNRYLPFTYGMLDIESAVFFLSITAVFVLFTAAVMERRRWT